MELYFLYIAIATITISSPGPGVILTISNSLRYGFIKAIYGIMGISLGILFLAIISATSLSIILSTSAFAFAILKYMGAIYLIYLGIKLWNSSGTFCENKDYKQKTSFKIFLEGITITLLNPKAIFFFASLFPQFINQNENYINQFITLSLIFSILVIMIHFLYAISASLARAKLTTPKISRNIAKTSGSILMCFGIGLAVSSRQV